TALVAATWACSSSSSPSQPAGDAGRDTGSSSGSSSGSSYGSGGDGGVAGDTGADAPAGAKVEHVVVIVQGNPTFDNYFANWCTAAPGSSPTCTQGASCCETGPLKDPGSSATPSILNDSFNAARDPDHHAACEQSEMDNGKMDAYATASCGSAQNIAYA